MVFLAIVGAVLFVKPGQRANLKSLYARRRWFELRDAVEASHWQAPALYRAAVAYAFHDLDAAVKLALEAVRTSLDRGDVIRARYVLADAYSWSGRYTEALAELNAIGSSTDLSDRALYSAAARFPPQAVIRGAVSTIKWDETELSQTQGTSDSIDGLWVELLIIRGQLPEQAIAFVGQSAHIASC